MAERTTRQITGGNFQSPDGTPLALGYVTFRLNTDGAVPGTNAQVSAGVITTAMLDSNGNIAGTVYLWPNSYLLPATVYIIKAYTASGNLCWESENVIPSAGFGAFDIGTLIPLF